VVSGGFGGGVVIGIGTRLTGSSNWGSLICSPAASTASSGGICWELEFPGLILDSKISNRAAADDA
jgi:hypothetical protein